MSRYYMLAIAVMVFFCMEPLLAQETGSFMRNPAEARTMSLAGAGIVSADDVSAFDNAALTPFSRENLSVNASMLMWMPKMYNNQVSYSASARYSFRKAGTFYLGARELKYPSLEQTDDYGNVTGTSRPGDLAVEAGYAYPFLRDFSAALTARYLRLNPGYGSVANAVSFDAGLGFRHCFNATGPLTDVVAIVQIRDFGSSPDYGNGRRSLPRRVNAGASAGLCASDMHFFRAGASADISATSCVHGAAVSFGAEYSFRRMLYLRGGYHLGSISSGEPSWGAIGLGLHFWNISVDAGWIISTRISPLRNTLSATISFLL